MHQIEMLTKYLDHLVWGPALLFLLIGTGFFLMVRLYFLPLRRLKEALSYLCKDHKANGETGISPFQALTTELAATIGIGNIVGVAAGMALGGPGALFWMILSSFFGMAIKLVESTLSVTFRVKNEIGHWVGGPMYTMKRALPYKVFGQKMGAVYAFFAVMASFGMGNMVQANAITQALHISFGWKKTTIGLFLCICIILVILGGVKAIGKVTGILVPVMAVFYVVGCVWVIGTHKENIIPALTAIVVGAFCPKAVSGALFGEICITVAQSLRWGISRGVFSNEAGLGAAGISAAAANTTEPVKQGYISMTGVFLDTVVICSLSGVTLAVSGGLGNGTELDGTKLMLAAFESGLGRFGILFLSISITLFAFATIVGWEYQGERAFEYLVHSSRKCLWYRFLYGFISFAGALCSLQFVWDFSDLCNGLMVYPNLICILILAKQAVKEILDYDEKRKKR